MKKVVSLGLTLVLMFMNVSPLFAAAAQPQMAQKQLQAAPNARPIEFAFVFDGPSDKNQEVLKVFQGTITKSLSPDYKAVFPKELIFTGDWSDQSAIKMSDKALSSRALMVISLGYMSSAYLTKKKNVNKYVVTIDEYGLRDMGSSAFFNPVKQSVNDFILFKNSINPIKQ